jgi:hypothetical protein
VQFFFETRQSFRSQLVPKDAAIPERVSFLEIASV